jgi:N-acetylglutamate synthase-like GNAT family acetyltransferase
MIFEDIFDLRKSIRMEHVELRQLTMLGDEVMPFVIEAESRGQRFMRRLLDDWVSGANRFQKNGEFLLSARIEGRLVAVGGLNKDPYALSGHVGRLRHVYDLDCTRRLGIGTLLVKRIMDDAAERFSMLRLHTKTIDAAEFYERLGFQKTNEQSATHIIRLKVISSLSDAPKIT